MLLYFQLPPELSGTTITDVEIRLQIESVASKGVDALLHGLHTCASTLSEILAQQSMVDYFIGTDPPSGTELLSARLLERDGAAAGDVYTHSSSQLSSYVQARVDAGGGDKFMSLRLTISSDMGCGISVCSSDCPFWRNKFAPGSASMVVHAIESVSPNRLPLPPPAPSPHHFASPSMSPSALPSQPSLPILPLGVPAVFNLTACVTRMYKTAGSTPKIRDNDQCLDSSNVAVLGVDGSGIACTRKVNIVLTHFWMPAELAGSDSVEAELSLAVADMIEGGIDVVLHGIDVQGQEVGTPHPPSTRPSSPFLPTPITMFTHTPGMRQKRVDGCSCLRCTLSGPAHTSFSCITVAPDRECCRLERGH